MHLIDAEIHSTFYNLLSINYIRHSRARIAANTGMYLKIDFVPCNEQQTV